MTVDADTPDLPQTPETAEDAAAKPVRRRRAAKAAPADDAPGEAPASDAVTAAVAEPVASGDAPAARPRRRRASSSVDAPAVSGDAVMAPADAGAASPQASAAPAQASGDVAPPPALASVGMGDAPATEGVAEAPEGAAEDAETDGAGEGTGRSRRRRKDRPSRAERERRAAEGAAAPAAEARPATEGDADLGDEDDDEPAEGGQPRAVPADPGEVFAQVVSGEFDADGEELPEPPPPHKRVLLPEPEAPKLQKVLAQSGIGSRRDMETLIQEGQVSVNGEPAHIGQRISFGDRIAVRGKPIRVRIVPPPPRIIAYHKPVGEVVTHEDPQQRPTVFRRLPRLPQGKWQSVGRLDLNTEGLLLFTNSGELANQLMHPRFGVEREYAVRVLGKLDEMDKAQLLEGVNIDGQTASFRSIEDGGGEGANHWYRVVITEGRNREVRKLFDAVELTVSRLIRIRYGTVVLPRGLKRGVWVDLDPADVRAIRQLAGSGAKSPEARAPQQPGQPMNGKDRGRHKGPRPDRGDRPMGDRPPRPQGGPGPRPPQGPRPSSEFQPPVERERERHDDLDDDFDPARIPNPLEQTFDKRFVQNPRTPAGGRGFGRGGGGFGAGGSAPPPVKHKPGAPREPDPLQTSVGYIGADAFHRKNRGGGGGGNRGGFGGPNNRGGGGKRGR